VPQTIDELTTRVNLRDIGRDAHKIITNVGWQQGDMVYVDQYKEPIPDPDADPDFLSHCSTGGTCAFGGLALAAAPNAWIKRAGMTGALNELAWAMYDDIHKAIGRAAPDSPLGNYGFGWNDDGHRTREEVVNELLSLPDYEFDITVYVNNDGFFKKNEDEYEDEDDD
jgi:hypothetical protein